jgi:hypothetical protein
LIIREAAIPRRAGLTARHDVPTADIAFWNEIAGNRVRILDDPNFCYREFLVAATGRVPA